MSDVLGFLWLVKNKWRRILTGSATTAVLGLISGTGKIHVPGFVYWLIICITLFWAFFGVWKDEHITHQKAERLLLGKREVELLKRTRKLLEDMLQLMRKFPNSPAVLNPFSHNWRPLVGATDYGWDVKGVME